jgi:hypothetical protein
MPPPSATKILHRRGRRREAEEALLERARADLLAVGVNSSDEHIQRAMPMATTLAAREVTGRALRTFGTWAEALCRDQLSKWQTAGRMVGFG